MEWFGTALEVKILNNRRKSNSSGFKLVREKCDEKSNHFIRIGRGKWIRSRLRNDILMILGVLFKISHELATPENTSSRVPCSAFKHDVP